MTREEILDIDRYCSSNSVSVKSRLKELGISEYAYYNAKRKYRREDERQFLPATQGGFIQLPAPMPPKRSHTSKRADDALEAGQNNVTLELRAANGAAMRIQGTLTSAAVRGIVEALSEGHA